MADLDAPTLQSSLWTDKTLVAPHEIADKAARVRGMFNAIAHRYELVNTVFSGGRDAAWRRRAVSLVEVQPDDIVLDVACGTGDLTRTFAAAGPAVVVGTDFAHGMLIRAQRQSAGAMWCEGDAQCLPYRDESFSIVSCAFGVRNLQNLDAGLREMRRVLRPGGRAVILEFTRPRNALMRRLYEIYSHRIMPLAATLLSGDRTGAYRYLPKSVVSFANAERFCESLGEAGFQITMAHPMTMGVVTIYLAHRS